MRKAADQCIAALNLCRESHSVDCAPDISIVGRMANSSIVTISKDPRHLSESIPPTGIADKPMSDACFNDWKRFCFVLREIASGDNSRPLSGLAAQKRAQAALTECGYTWPGCVQVPEPIAAPFAGQKSLSTQARVDLEQFPLETN
jgi:hypothetical protein